MKLCNLHQIDISVGQIGTTVRRGNKWFNQAKPQQEIELCVCNEVGNHNVIGVGVIEEMLFTTFSEIPARLIESEHEMSSRLYSGLLYSMRKAYGKDFNESELVTVIKYRRVK